MFHQGGRAEETASHLVLREHLKEGCARLPAHPAANGDPSSAIAALLLIFAAAAAARDLEEAPRSPCGGASHRGHPPSLLGPRALLDGVLHELRGQGQVGERPDEDAAREREEREPCCRPQEAATRLLLLLLGSAAC